MRDTINIVFICLLDKYYFLKEEEWLNPHNWATQLNGKLVEGQLSANPIPHTDRIPCRGDDVIFPDQATIKVKISLSQDLMLSSLRLNNVQFSNDSLNRFLATKTGQMIFRNTNRRLLINSQLSTNNVCDKQCPCDTERSQLIDQICPLITCQAINCENAIQPPGHCCPLCAVMVKVLPKDGLNFVDFNRLFTNYIKNQLNDGSIGYAYSIEDKSMIAVFTNPQEFSSQKILSHGHNFMDILYYGKRKELLCKECEIFALIVSLFKHLSDYQFRHSSMELYPEEKNSFFTNFILLLLAVALAYALYSGINYYRRNEIRISWPRARSRFRPSSQFTFIRFRGLEEAERATMELETATDIVASVSSLAKESSLEKKESTMLSLIPEEFFSVSNEVNHLHDNDERGKTATISESLFHDDSQMDTISLDKLIN